MPRPLPTPAEAAEILARKRTRPQRRPPPVAGRGLSKLLKELDAKYGQGPGALQARWREIVGVELAKRTEPVKLTKPRGGGPGALEIRVAGASAALSNLSAHGGFAPNGVVPVLTGAVAATGVYGGAEIVTIAAAEIDVVRDRNVTTDAGRWPMPRNHSEYATAVPARPSHR